MQPLLSGKEHAAQATGLHIKLFEERLDLRRNFVRSPHSVSLVDSRTVLLSKSYPRR